MNIKTPSQLCELKRYEDPEAGTLIECIPLDQLLPRWYLGEVLLNGQHTIRFKLAGTTIEEALNGWAATLGQVLYDMSKKQEAAQEEQKKQHLRSQILSAMGPARRM